MLAIERGTTLPGGQNRTPGAPHQGAGRQLAQLREAGARGESARRLERSGTDRSEAVSTAVARPQNRGAHPTHNRPPGCAGRSEEHTSELQSRENIVCRLLLEK